MTRRSSTPHLARPPTRAATIATAVLLAAGPVIAGDLSTPLCEVLAELNPEVQTYTPEGASAQLVMAIAEKFDYDPARLEEVEKQIDAATTAGCPSERAKMLAVLKTSSLAAGLD